MTVHDLRRVLLQKLIAKHGGPSAFAARTGIDESTLSRVAGRNAREPIGTRLAARVERALDLPAGHLSDFSTLLDTGRKLDALTVSVMSASQKKLIGELLAAPLHPSDVRLLLSMLRRLK